jgi:hypothetical protein
MDELVNLVSQKTGLSEEMSKQVVTIVLDYLKQQLPEPIAGQIDSLLQGGGDSADLGGLVQGLGGLFGSQ